MKKNMIYHKTVFNTIDNYLIRRPNSSISKWDVTNVDSYSLYACTYVASVRDISKIACYHQVLFAAVTNLQQFEEKTNKYFCCFSVSQNSTSNLLHIIRHWKITRIYNLPHVPLQARWVPTILRRSIYVYNCDPLWRSCFVQFSV